MLNYIALIWNPADENQRLTAQHMRFQISVERHWHVAIDQSGLFVAVDPPKTGGVAALPLSDLSGVILGVLFNRQSERPIFGPLNRQLSEAISTSSGKTLITEYWGSYILFLSKPRNRTTYILRSPASRLPCFYSVHDGIRIFTSSVDDCFRLGWLRPRISWQCIIAQAANGNFLSRDTALVGVRSLECGECAMVSGDSLALSIYWTPTSVARQRVLSDFERASEELHATSQQCVRAWTHVHNRVLLQLSGGVDSSIVLSCLKNSEAALNITCVNLFTPMGAGDERVYARAMAEHCDVSLLERERSLSADLKVFLSCARTAYPVLNFSAYESDAILGALTRDLGATAVFDGELGDELFGHWPGREALAEYIWRNGLSRGLFRTATDFGLLRRQSVWRALLPAIRDALIENPSYWDPYQLMKEVLGGQIEERSLLDQNVFDEYDRNSARFLHPWFHDVKGVPPGKLRLIHALVGVTSPIYHRPFAHKDDAPVISPLVSQPLVELALQIASYLHFCGGVDRAVARHAFARELHRTVLERRGKGNSDSLLREIVRQNRQFLREVLLDGILVRERILSREKIELVLSPEVTGTLIPAIEVIEKLYIEAWLRRWNPGVYQAAA